MNGRIALGKRPHQALLGNEGDIRCPNGVGALGEQETYLHCHVPQPLLTHEGAQEPGEEPRTDAMLGSRGAISTSSPFTSSQRLPSLGSRSKSSAVNSVRVATGFPSRAEYTYTICTVALEVKAYLTW